MTGYIINFGVYTMAMIGLIAMCTFIYKKSNVLTLNNKSSLKIDDKIALNVRKSLYVVNAGGERFLIAGDIDNTSLIARLGQENVTEINETMTSLITPSIQKTNEETKENNEPNFDEVVPIREKKFISRDAEYLTLPVFKPESSKSENSLSEAFERVNLARNGKYLDIKAIRKKPVMKELARKLAQI